MQLGAKERRVLELLCYNCRFTNSEISKKIGISRERVSHIIKKLEENGILMNYTAEINFNSLGFFAYGFSIKLQNCTQLREVEISKGLTEIKNIVFLEKILGKFDFAGAIFTKSIQELDSVLNKLRIVINKELSSLIIDQIVMDYDFFADFFSEKFHCSLEISFFTDDSVEIDTIDEKILLELIKNSRTSIVDISQKLKISIPIVTYRLKKFVKEKVILAFRPIVNFELLGYNRYTLLLDFIDSANEKRLIEFCRQHRLIWDVSKHIGNYNIIMEIFCVSNAEFKQLVEEIISEFAGNIVKYDILIVTEEIKHSYFFK